jgi:predicted amidophosphoribosyltransferase
MLQAMKSLKSWLFPPSCVFCHALMEHEGEHCCALCLADIHPLSIHQCRHCGVPMPEVLAPGPCGKCLTDKPIQSSTTSLYAYQGVVRDGLLAWKLQGQDGAVAWLIEVAASRLQGLIGTEDILIPVPMPLSRMRKQGRHHAADLCRLIAQQVGCTWDWRVLRRKGEQVRQSSLTAAARRKNLRKAFTVDADYWHHHCKHVQRVWLIDDIITTGMTVHFASKALYRVCNEIHVLSLTRAVKGGG